MHVLSRQQQSCWSGHLIKGLARWKEAGARARLASQLLMHVAGLASPAHMPCLSLPEQWGRWSGTATRRHQVLTGARSLTPCAATRWVGTGLPAQPCSVSSTCMAT